MLPVGCHTPSVTGFIVDPVVDVGSRSQETAMRCARSSRHENLPFLSSDGLIDVREMGGISKYDEAVASLNGR